MSWLDDLAVGVAPAQVKIGTIAPGAPLRVSWDGGEPQQPLWSSDFDLVLSVKGVDDLAGAKVLILLPEKQPPVISTLLMGGPSDATV